MDAQPLPRGSELTIAEEAASSPDVQACFSHYFEELDRRFDTGFEVARSNRADVADLTPPAGLVLVARSGGDAVGCGALKLDTDGVAELKRMWVAPRARGLGLGRRLLRELEDHALEHGSTVARLETNRNLVEAIAMYRGAGYREVPAFNDEPYAHHWFEKQLT
jgi:ribosomal protein S18 acetylase RimI-like enzyme